jgi:hypothetical protein
VDLDELQLRDLAAALDADGPGQTSRSGLVAAGVAISIDSPEFELAHARKAVARATDKLAMLVEARQLDASVKSNAAQALTAVIRTCIVPSFTHVLRGHDPDVIRPACVEFDDAVWLHWRRLVGLPNRHLTKQQVGDDQLYAAIQAREDVARRLFFLPALKGGLGMESAEATADAAFVGAFALGAHLVHIGFDAFTGPVATRGRRTNQQARLTCADARPRGPGAATAEPLPARQPAASAAEADARAVNDGAATVPDLSVIRGLPAAWDRIREMPPYKGLAAADIIREPVRYAQKLAMHAQAQGRADAIAEAVSAHRPEDLPYLRAQAGGLMGYAVAALPTSPSLVICDREYEWAVRARLLLPLFNPGDRDALPAADERLCRGPGCRKPTDPIHGWHMFTCSSLAPSVSRLSHTLADAATTLRRAAGFPDMVHLGKRVVRRVDKHTTGRCGKLAVDAIFDRRPNKPALEADDAYTAPGGTPIISDTHVITPDRELDNAVHGAALKTGMSVKTDLYENNYVIPAGSAKHMIYERLGAVHVDTRAVLVKFAKAKAQRCQIEESVSVQRTLQEFGAIFLRDLGYSMRVYAELCAPHPRLIGGAGAVGQGGPRGSELQQSQSQSQSQTGSDTEWASV